MRVVRARCATLEDGVRPFPTPHPSEETTVLAIALAMLVTLALAGLVVTYVAYPHRGEEIPAAPWLGDAMTRAVEAAPTLEGEPADDRDPVPAGRQRAQA
jgi:hypothetical protein